ncbi:diacylglycerol/lipid kinase family protein [Enterovirga rhinocerotis]|uniref:Diacylglycerol kinase family enzyme n=1 Tax=Enterovirga rhinocerotis TaxID=1339210 RepID=A0A4R7BUU9_9HYPH|nr:diacylglycerol kinase family protein [Enterovirga rhinocerotis]TDR87967.1 diacylglycerol kinase family enzyme [Enterovirga rhinocerotis]
MPPPGAGQPGEGTIETKSEARRESAVEARAATLVHHPGAGEGDWSGERMADALRGAGIEPTLVEMGGADWEAAVDATKDLVIVAGGDGTIAAVTARIVTRKVSLGILPTGSGNNIARSLGILAPLEEIIPLLRNARHSPLRVGHATGTFGEHFFLESIGLGAIAHSVKELQDEKLDGDEKLIRGRDSLISAIMVQEPLDAALTVDGAPVEGRFLIVEAMNLSMIGPNLRLVPDTSHAGPNLSLALLLADDRERMVEWLSAGGQGVAPLRHLQGRRIAFEGAPQPLRLGDKSIDWDGRPVEIALDDHRIDVLRPGDHR